MLGRTGAHQSVLGQVDVDRARTARRGDMEGLGEDTRDVVGIADKVVVLGAGQRDARDVDLLERVLAQERRDDVACDGDDRDGVEHGVADAGDQVRSSGAGRAEADADAAGRTSVAVGGVGRALLVPDEDVAQFRVIHQDVVEGQDDATGIAEPHVHALAEQ